MGLQGQLTDLSSDSIPLLFLALVASCVAYLRSAIAGWAHRLGSRSITSGRTDQLSLNKRLSYSYTSSSEAGDCCVVCMSTLSPGDRIRRLSCRHVFHKLCIDACIAHLPLNCPLCRTPFAAPEVLTSF